MRTNLQRREDARDIIQVRLRTEGQEPNDVEVLEHLNLRRHPIASVYDLIDARVTCTFSVLSTEAKIDTCGIMVSDPLSFTLIDLNHFTSTLGQWPILCLQKYVLVKNVYSKRCENT